MDTDKIVNFLFEIASLRRLTRSHRQFIADVNDNISDHSFRVAVIGMILANLEGCDANKVMKMCLFHDLAEARTGDANFINKQYLTLHEKDVQKDQMAGLPISEEILGLHDEYERRETRESVVAKDADLIDQMILQQEYFYKDGKNRPIWQKHTESLLKTEAAKRLAGQIREHNPFEWLYHAAEKKTGMKIER